MSVRGECLCGAIQFEVASISAIGLCHCSRCRRAYGGPFAIEAVVPADDFRFTSGEDFIRTHESAGDRSFCVECGSHVPFKAVGGKIQLVPAGLFVDDPGVRPSFHMYVGSKAPWWEINDDLPQHEEWLPGYGPSDESST